ncbi:MAG: OmpA family protein [Candidatus Competibacteraceae bacterium]|nr:OmpA family protein [Candidatus Competibacteraceae bacterium]MCB1822393.1 OmpA family protein [Candidatus Competibacteraceae bacterium]HRY14640.1 OmpA family protein [Candidatus Competibacteraceae bacterium]
MMSPDFYNKNDLTLGQIALIVMALSLAGCAKNYVVLLPNDDGTTGKVVVEAREGVTLLEKGREGADIGGAAGKTFEVSEKQIAKDFGEALAASPERPVSFLLYFEAGTDVLTPESEADLPKVFAEIRRRPAPDISVIGHTDTVGDADLNARLSLARARSTAAMISQLDASVISPDRISIESHGEKNLLVPTPDNTDEPRNRRVEITVR